MGYVGLNVFIIVPRVVPHVSHVFCVLLKELCVGDFQPMLLSPCQRGAFSDSHIKCTRGGPDWPLSTTLGLSISLQ